MPSAAQSDNLQSSLKRNIEAIAERRRREEAEVTFGERVARGITGFVGSLLFVVLHVVLYVGWAAINLGFVPGVPPFDPDFDALGLGLLTSMEAIFLSTFVLMTQNRMAAAAAKRADLDLQVSLLAEHEITRLVQMVADLSEHMGLDRRSAEVEEIQQDVAPEAVLDAIEAKEGSSAVSAP